MSLHKLATLKSLVNNYIKDPTKSQTRLSALARIETVETRIGNLPRYLKLGL